MAQRLRWKNTTPPYTCRDVSHLYTNKVASFLLLAIKRKTFAGKGYESRGRGAAWVSFLRGGVGTVVKKPPWYFSAERKNGLYIVQVTGTHLNGLFIIKYYEVIKMN